MRKTRRMLAVVLALSMIFACSLPASACCNWSQPAEPVISIDEVDENDVVFVDDEEQPQVMMAMLSSGTAEDEELEPLLSYEVYSSSIGRPGTVSAVLSSYDSIRISWTAVSGVDGYYVYYKKSTSSIWTRKAVSTTARTISDLADGVKYNIKVQAYAEKSNGKLAVGSMRAASSIYTLKKMEQPEVEKYSSTKVTVSWDAINGCDGYQISRSSSLTGTNIVSTVSDSVSSTKLTPPSDSRYYYKVRAFAEVNGTRVYAPWSLTKSFRL